MRRIAITAVSLLTLLLFAGCTGNLFMEWDRPNVPSASEISGRTVNDQSSAVDFLSDAGDWYDGDALSGDGEKSDAVASKLKEIYEDDTLDSETRQEAASLAGKVAVQSDPNAEQLSKNLIASFDELTSESGIEDTEAFIGSLVPAAAKDDLNTFTNMVNSLLKAADAYLALGESIGPDSTNYLDGELGDSVQYGAVSIAVVAALDSLDGETVGSISSDTELSESECEDLFNLVNGGTETFTYDPMDV
ncbi:MAG: hypothetical protein ACOC2R_05955, partial [Spirochaetota bacterium]